MEREDLLSLFKFYKGEETNPFTGKEPMKAKWWEGEKALLETAIEGKRWEVIVDSLKEAIRDKEVHRTLADDTIPIENRAIVYYLDIWNSRWFPNDSLDDIFDYVKG